MTFNQEFFDASVRHQIDLLRLGSGVARKVNAILDATRADLAKQVQKRLAKGAKIDSGGIKRLAELERAIDQQRSGAWNDVTKEWTRTAVDVAIEESVFLEGTLTSIVPVELDLVQPSPRTLRALATTRPFEGRLLKEWAQSAARSDISRIKQQIRIGMVQGESAADIARRVFGSKGAMALTRGQAEAVTRTVISGVANTAQQAFLAENADLFDQELFVATLDSRTTPVCRANDGKRYPLGQGPIPPLHVACRSLRVGTIDGEVVGERPFKAGTEQQMLREYADAQRIDRVRSRDDLPRGHKQSFDAFSRRRMREMTGQVPAHTSYQEWLARQPAEIQDDILGPTRGKLFREGGLTLDKFVNREGDELTLDELRERNRAAWDKAGVGRTAAERAEAHDRAEAERARTEREIQSREARSRIGRYVERFQVGSSVSAELLDVAARAIEKVGLRGVNVMKLGRQIEKAGSEGLYFPSTRSVSIKSEGLSASGTPLPDKPGPGKLFSMGTQPATQAAAVRNTIYHELGHHAHIHGNARLRSTGTERQREAAHRIEDIIERRWNARDREYITDYAVHPKTPEIYKSSEYFAEAFAAYHAEPAWLQRVAPKAYTMVDEVIKLRREAE